MAHPALFEWEGRGEREGEKRGEGDCGTLLFQSTITFTFKTSKPNFKVEYFKTGEVEGEGEGRERGGERGREKEGEGSQERVVERGGRRGGRGERVVICPGTRESKYQYLQPAWCASRSEFFRIFPSKLAIRETGKHSVPAFRETVPNSVPGEIH